MFCEMLKNRVEYTITDETGYSAYLGPIKLAELKYVRYKIPPKKKSPIYDRNPNPRMYAKAYGTLRFSWFERPWSKPNLFDLAYDGPLVWKKLRFSGVELVRLTDSDYFAITDPPRMGVEYTFFYRYHSTNIPRK